MPLTTLIVISGPSGCGKTTIAREILKKHPDMLFSVSMTTRPRRATEVEGNDYFFVTKNVFEEKVQRGELVEWERIYDDDYGTPTSEVDRAITSGKPMVFDVDVKGALSIKRKYPEHTMLVFIKPPSLEVLVERLRSRKTETNESFTKRMERVAMELEQARSFDHVVINDTLTRAITEVDEIIKQALHTRLRRQEIKS